MGKLKIEFKTGMILFIIGLTTLLITLVLVYFQLWNLVTISLISNLIMIFIGMYIMFTTEDEKNTNSIKGNVE